ncbi:MAG: hypothetical protein F4030_09960 [Gammaproteobacteria bacterium]|nr:hypothetical protein [Gammaproteobacteria bacterium]MYH86440.1 hypothetical protein [Gammaproteobacteria bacterium]MYK05293.1 hypothetical protein [Gammaproteobacteria bacterium]
MTKRPNLFDYATSELSQDAFLCWLIQWADHKYATVDPALHRTATEFLKSIGRKFDNNPFKEATALQVEIEQQYKYIDVLVRIKIGDQKYALVIEDKTDSTARKGQLEQYRETIKKEYPESNLLLVYLKTGEILPEAKREARISKYVVYSRNDLLRVLETGANETNDSILSDFYQRLKSRDDLYQKYLTPLKDWKDSKLAWEGFFSELHKNMEKIIVEEKEKIYWDFVNNRGGGESRFGIWHTVGLFSVHLLLVKKWDKTGRHFLALKVGEVRKNRSKVRNKFHQSLMEHAKTSRWSGKLERPARWGNGAWMVIAESKEKDYWLPMDDDGKVNMDETVEKLNEAYKLLCEFECE